VRGLEILVAENGVVEMILVGVERRKETVEVGLA
jgi:hypothetical protein